MTRPEDIYKEYRDLLMKRLDVGGQQFSFNFITENTGTFSVTGEDSKDMIGGTVKLTVNNDGLNILMDYKGFYITQTLKIAKNEKGETTLVREPNSGKVFLTGHKLDS